MTTSQCALPNVPAGGHRHPDAELLDLCARLRVLEAGWQRIWLDGTDDELMTYSAEVWPATGFMPTFLREDYVPEDLPGQLLTLRATTAEGVQAKAAAIAAIDDVASYTDNRNDMGELNRSILEDAAGQLRPLMARESGRTPSIPKQTIFQKEDGIRIRSRRTEGAGA